MSNLDRATDAYLRELIRQKDKIETIIHQVKKLRDGNGDIGPPSKKLSGDWAEEVLRRHKNAPMHYRAIAHEAIAAGYTGISRPDESVGSVVHVNRVAHSYSGTLSREKDRFHATGGGNYRLKDYQES